MLGGLIVRMNMNFACGKTSHVKGKMLICAVQTNLVRRLSRIGALPSKSCIRNYFLASVRDEQSQGYAHVGVSGSYLHYGLLLTRNAIAFINSSRCFF